MPTLAQHSLAIWESGWQEWVFIGVYPGAYLPDVIGYGTTSPAGVVDQEMVHKNFYDVVDYFIKHDGSVPGPAML